MTTIESVVRSRDRWRVIAIGLAIALLVVVATSCAIPGIDTKHRKPAYPKPPVAQNATTENR